MPMPTLNSAPTLTSKNDTVVYTSGFNSGGVREGVRACAVSAGQGVHVNLCLHVKVDSCVKKKHHYFFEKRSIVLQRAAVRELIMHNPLRKYV